MPEFVYSLCTLTSIACAILLLRAYRTQPTPLLFWSGICFVGLALNNLLLLVDLYVVPSIDLFLPRTSIAVVAMFALLFGLVSERR
jgi:hypothetical protein